MKPLRFAQAIVLISGLIVTVVAYASDPAPKFPSEHISLDDWKTYLAEVKAIPDVISENTNTNELYCLSNAQMAVWVFTVEGNRAHPAVATAVLVSSGRVAAGMLFRGYYVDDATAFWAWGPGAIGNRQIFDRWTQAALGEAPNLRWSGQASAFDRRSREVDHWG